MKMISKRGHKGVNVMKEKLARIIYKRVYKLIIAAIICGREGKALAGLRKFFVMSTAYHDIKISLR